MGDTEEPSSAPGTGVTTAEFGETLSPLLAQWRAARASAATEVTLVEARRRADQAGRRTAERVGRPSPASAVADGAGAEPDPAAPAAAAGSVPAADPRVDPPVDPVVAAAAAPGRRRRGRRRSGEADPPRGEGTVPVPRALAPGKVLGTAVVWFRRGDLRLHDQARRGGRGGGGRDGAAAAPAPPPPHRPPPAPSPAPADPAPPRPPTLGSPPSTRPA